MYGRGVSALNIRNALLRLFYVADGYVFSVPDSTWINRVAVLVRLQKQDHNLCGDLRALSLQNLRIALRHF